ncbi:phosphoribosylglycinamide formyltransferase [Flavobacteriales bacterium]|nr:phosphoribosylglycinamide formyltransferase [Flavobacteriales bacterium]
MKKLAIFGSGGGGNAENICVYFNNSSDIKVVVMCTNRKDAFIIERAKKLKIPMVFTSKTELESFDDLAKILAEYKVDYIILAGFLLKIPSKMIEQYPNKIINIHPALLPKYGGKGMYGKNIYKAVLENKETQTGITIHLVNQNYDEGKIIKQYACDVSKTENLSSLESKIHKLEFSNFPQTLEKYILKN